MNNWMRIGEEKYRHPFFGTVNAHYYNGETSVVGDIFLAKSADYQKPLHEALKSIEAYQTAFENLMTLPKKAFERSQERKGSGVYDYVYSVTENGFAKNFIITNDYIELGFDCFNVTHFQEQGIIIIKLSHQDIQWTWEIAEADFDATKILNCFESRMSGFQNAMNTFDSQFCCACAKQTKNDDYESIQIKYLIDENKELVALFIHSEKYGQMSVAAVDGHMTLENGDDVCRAYLNS